MCIRDSYKLAAVGKKKFSDKYLRCDNMDNIFHKEENYSELTFHYWFWKNQLQHYNDHDWIGFCQKRRFWLNSRSTSETNDITKIILQYVPKEWEKYNSVLCEPIPLGTKLSKLLKRGWASCQHPDIASAFASLFPKILLRMDILLKINQS